MTPQPAQTTWKDVLSRNQQDTAIPSGEVTYHPLSYGDPGGRLFWWKGELYRGIYGQRSSLYLELFRCGLIADLISKHSLIHTELTALTLTGFDLILRHRTITFASYPHEWCAEMLKAAAECLLSLSIELAKHNLVLQDAHPWNLLFDGPRPIYVDFASIVPAEQSQPWLPYQEFREFFLHPLWLIEQGHHRIVRMLLQDDQRGIAEQEFMLFQKRTSVRERLGRAKKWIKGLLSPRVKAFLRLLRARVISREPVDVKPILFLEQLLSNVRDIRISRQETGWSGYYETLWPFDDNRSWNAKQRSVSAVLSDIRPKTVLDVASNRGWYAQLAASLGAVVVAYDIDEGCVAQLYQDALSAGQPVLPLVMDFLNPSPARGICFGTLASAPQRLHCQFVLALGIVHHLVFKKKLSFAQIVDQLSTFVSEWLLIEFIPHEDRYVREWWTEEYSWYTIENFEQSLLRQFRSITRVPSFPEPRVLVLCQR